MKASPQFFSRCARAPSIRVEHPNQRCLVLKQFRNLQKDTNAAETDLETMLSFSNQARASGRVSIGIDLGRAAVLGDILRWGYVLLLFSVVLLGVLIKARPDVFTDQTSRQKEAAWERWRHAEHSVYVVYYE